MSVLVLLRNHSVDEVNKMNDRKTGDNNTGGGIQIGKMFTG